jgi:hypothetical protein
MCLPLRSSCELLARWTAHADCLALLGELLLGSSADGTTAIGNDLLMHAENGTGRRNAGHRNTAGGLDFKPWKEGQSHEDERSRSRGPGAPLGRVYVHRLVGR